MDMICYEMYYAMIHNLKKRWSAFSKKYRKDILYLIIITIHENLAHESRWNAS